MSSKIIKNAIFSLASSLGGQFLNYKAAEQEFKNPLLNGLQMAVMMSGTLDYNNLPTEATSPSNNPILYGLAMAADDFLIDKLGWTSKHYLTDIVSAVDIFDSFSSKTKGCSIDNYVAPITIGLLSFKWLREYYSGSKGHIHALRDMQLKITNNVKNLEYVTDGLTNIKTALITQTLIASSCCFAEKVINHPQFALLKMELNQVMEFIYLIFSSQQGVDRIKEKNLKILDSAASMLKISSDTQYSQTFQNIERISLSCDSTIRKSLMLNSGLQKFNHIFNQSKGLFPLFNLMNTVDYLYSSANHYEQNMALEELQSTGSKIKGGLISNPRTIIERDGLNYFGYHNALLNEKIKQLTNDVASNNSKLFFGASAGIVLSWIAMILSMPKNQFQQFKSPHTNVDSIQKNIINKCDIALDLMHGYTSIFGLPELLKNEPNLHKLASLYKFLETIKNTSKVAYQCHDYESLKGLYFNNIDMKINGVDKLHMDHLFLESGNWYLLTGKSGCGKTTLMSTLRGLPNFAESIEISGNAFYPKTTSDGKPQIYMLTQNNNFPYMVSIMEAILYPMITTEEERVSYKQLVEEIMLKMDGITRDSEDGKEYLESGLLSRLFEIENDIYSVTSGGQQKKMALTGLIVRVMKETGMLNIYNKEIYEGHTHDKAMKIAKDSVGSVLVLIDEVFNGLDSGMSSAGFALSSKGYVMKTLKESLPTKAIIVSVEHQAQLDQYNHRIHLNGDGTHAFTNPQTGNIESMKSHDMSVIQSETFYPFNEILEDSVDTICDSNVSELENIQPLPELIYVTAAA